MTALKTELLAPDTQGLRRAAAILRAGGRVAFPTETVYGLGADARNATAVAGIFEAKNRPAFNPLIVHVAGLTEARKLAAFNAPAFRLARAFWPGPLTLVLPLNEDANLSDLVSAGLPTLAIRVPAGKTAQALLREFNGPIAAPSANPAGRLSPTEAMHVLESLSGRIEAIVDGGPCRIGLESTIIGFDRDKSVLLRPGGLPLEDIEACLGCKAAPYSGSTISAPGQLASHYAPQAALRLNAQSAEADEAWLGFATDPANIPAIALNLSPGGDLRIAAANLFAHLRQLDALATKAGLSRVAIAPIPQTGLGRAINDRLKRAAAPRSGPATLG